MWMMLGTYVVRTYVYDMFVLCGSILFPMNFIIIPLCLLLQSIPNHQAWIVLFLFYCFFAIFPSRCEAFSIDLSKFKSTKHQQQFAKNYKQQKPQKKRKIIRPNLANTGANANVLYWIRVFNKTAAPCAAFSVCVCERNEKERTSL